MDDFDKLMVEANKKLKERGIDIELTPKELLKSIELSNSMVSSIKEMKLKSKVYYGSKPFEIIKDMDGSMWAIASSLHDNDGFKTENLSAEGVALMNVNPSPMYHLKEMFKHFMAYKSIFIAYELNEKKEKN